MGLEALARDRRAVYRVRPAHATAVRIGLSTQRGDHAVDALEDVSAYGASVVLPETVVPPLAAEERVRFAVRSSDAGEQTITLGARVLSRSRAADGWRYRFAFDPDARALAAARGAFFELFNRRAAWRGVRPAAGEPVRAAVRLADDPEQTAHAVEVQNICTGGVCVAASIDVDAALAGAQRVAVELELPSAATVALAASVRYRAVRDDAVLYGLRFEPQHTPAYLQHAEDLLEYILGRFERDLDDIVS